AGDLMRWVEHHRRATHRAEHRLVLMPTPTNAMDRHRIGLGERILIGVDQIHEGGERHDQRRRSAAIGERTAWMEAQRKAIAGHQPTLREVLRGPGAADRDALVPQLLGAGDSVTHRLTLMLRPGKATG